MSRDVAERILVLGRPTCEDTQIVESRLRAWGIPFTSRNIETDAAAEREVLARTGGNRVTPTIVVGDDRETVAEPTLEALGALLVRAGYAEAHPPEATRLFGEAAARPLVPPFPATHRGRAATVVLFTHGEHCLACLGYARQLGGQAGALADEEALAVLVVPADDAPTPHPWRDELDPRVALTPADVTRWAGSGVRLLVLDQWGAPRAESASAEAGGLIDPTDAVAWVRYLALECPECTEELDWR